MIIAIISAKGGTGKTTSALNLGAALAEAGEAVTLADLDTLQHDLYSFKGTIPGAKWTQSLPKKEPKGHLILDCPPRLEPHIAEAVQGADLVLIPVQPNLLSARGLLRLDRDLEELPPERVRAFITMYSARYKEAKLVLQRDLGPMLCKTVVPTSYHVVNAADAGQSVLQYAPDSSGAKAYRKLGKEVLNYAGLE